MNRSTLLLIIDMQYDFCKPEGALYVRGAEKDVGRLCQFISKYESEISNIILTQDYHNVIDISHPVFWEDSKGNPPEPFTIINSINLQQGDWRPRFEKEKAVKYLQNLEIQGEFPHTIWPEHCIIGSKGASIVDEIMEPVKKWARKGNAYEVVTKGTNPLTEHFGALMANIPIDGSPETQFNAVLAEKLQKFDNILVAGEAKSHCVAATIKQMLTIEGVARKMLVLEDCMSDVPGFETLASPIYEDAKLKGVKFIRSIDLLR
jgi:nicotinamidase/pyrazinamidase